MFWKTVHANYRERLRQLQLRAESEESEGSGAPGDKSLQELMAQGNSIEVVRKADVFSENVTANEMDIINRRVELQRIQYLEYTKREERRKIRRIRTLFPHLTEEEVKEALLSTEEDEEAILLQFTQFDFLIKIRKMIALKNTPHVIQQGNLSATQLEMYEKMMKKRSTTQKKAATEERRKSMYKMQFGRLRLDDALKQLNEGSGSMEGWSEARIRAFKIMKDNPNAYYYRFNAPGEAQRNGQWTAAERELFMKRLAEIGANGQWGIFSMAIPGRVGYQCSNFYRRLIESGQVVDPNYFIDQKGKAHYLFSTKKLDDNTVKVAGEDDENPAGSTSTSSSDAAATSTSLAAASAAAMAAVARAEKANAKKAAKAAKAAASAASTASKKRNTRKRKRYSSDSDESDDEFDADDSGYYGKSRRSGSSSSSATGTTRRTRAKAEAAAAASASTSTTTKVSGGSSSPSSTSAGPANSSSSLAPLASENTSAVDSSAAEMGSGSADAEDVSNSGAMFDMDDYEDDSNRNPLPGFIDPITHDEVVKPAISPYGHVMGYYTWIRCLNSEDRKNICPFTKKPLKKRELVVLNMDNIEEYRSKIVNLNR